MFCIIAFIVLSILGIFSASNRQLAKEALDCVLRRVTLRPCTTGFDEKMKAKILGVVITRSEGAARFLNKYFELLAWIFFLLLVASGVFTIRGLYLFYTTGSCNGLNETAFCVFDPTGKNNQASGLDQPCRAKPTTASDLTLKGVDLSTFPVQNATNPQKIVFIGCYHCDFTRKAYPLVRELVDKYHYSFTFLQYPTKESTDYFTKISYCANKLNPDAFWKLNDEFFTGDKSRLDDDATLQQMESSAGYDPAQIKQCTSDPATETAVKAQMNEIVKTQFFGTPTVFINGKALVGPKPYRVYAIMLRGLFYW